MRFLSLNYYFIMLILYACGPCAGLHDSSSLGHDDTKKNRVIQTGSVKRGLEGGGEKRSAVLPQLCSIPAHSIILAKYDSRSHVFSKKLQLKYIFVTIIM